MHTTIPELRGIKRRLRDPDESEKRLGVAELLSILGAQRDVLELSLTERVNLTKVLSELVCQPAPSATARDDLSVRQQGAIRCASVYCLGILCCSRKVVDEASLANTIPVMAGILSSLVLRHLPENSFPLEEEGAPPLQLNFGRSDEKFEASSKGTPFKPEIIPGDLSTVDVSLADLRNEVRFE